LNRTHGLTRTAVNAFIGLDIEHAVAFIDAVHRTFSDAGFIFHIDTWFGDHISHD
ncbi:MAG: hypothetical protein RL680_477, partial [Actinomycetota bacterium]